MSLFTVAHPAKGEENACASFPSCWQCGRMGGGPSTATCPVRLQPASTACIAAYRRGFGFDQQKPKTRDYREFKAQKTKVGSDIR